MARSIALFGGTFDPIHFGHLRVALDIKQLLPFDAVRLMPCNIPGHRKPPVASPQQRLEMVRLAMADEPGIAVDEREIQRAGVSYMADSLYSLREEFGKEVPLILVVGMDSFLTLHSWHRWESIPDLAHLLVIARPGSALPEDAFSERLLHARAAQSAEDLLASSHGRIWVQQLSMLDISATQIRGLLASGHSPRYLLPDRTLDYINQLNLYQ